ncbi:DUF6198 family protein [Ruminococcus sp.]
MENTTKELHSLRGELTLAAAVCINSLGVVLMLYSGAGISAISSVPFAFSEVLPRLTLGTWTYLFQGLLVLSLMVMRKRFVPPYLFSFVVGFVFGELLGQYRTKSVWRLCTPSACKFPVIFHKNAREYIKYSLRFLFHLTKNLTTHLSHNLCAVLPWISTSGGSAFCLHRCPCGCCIFSSATC